MLYSEWSILRCWINTRGLDLQRELYSSIAYIVEIGIIWSFCIFLPPRQMKITVSRKPVADQLDAGMVKNDASCIVVWATQVTANETKCNLRQEILCDQICLIIQISIGMCCGIGDDNFFWWKGWTRYERWVEVERWD